MAVNKSSSSRIKEREHEFSDFVEKLEKSPSRQINHRRYHRADIPYHVVSRIFEGVFRLVPTVEVTRIINGIFARARQNYPDIKLYAAVVLSNHFHLQLQGKPEEIPVFIGYIKREISRRIGKLQSRSGPMWAGYDSLALPGNISEMASFRYILAHGAKERLVKRPEEWPGLHCAKSLLSKKPLEGIWFDGTSFARLYDQESRKKKGQPDQIDPNDFTSKTELFFDKLPRWKDLSDDEYAFEIKEIIDEIVDEQRKKKKKKPIVGVKKIVQISIKTRKKWKPLPYHETRRRLICWGPPEARELQDYLSEYWAFQMEYKEASLKFRAGELNTVFPEHSFRPISFVGEKSRKLAA
jgi:REP element-mobilizing transposase RayT